MSIWDSVNKNGTLKSSNGSSLSGEKDKPFLGERDMRTSSYSDSVAPTSAEMAHVSDVIESMQRDVVALRQQLMAVEDNVTGVVKASAQATSETAKHKDIWNLEVKLQEFGNKNAEERSGFIEALKAQENFLERLTASQDSQKEAFTSFANEIRRKDSDVELARLNAASQQVLVDPTNADSLENSMCADMDPVIAEMARRAGIGLEDLHDIALKITEVNKSDAVAQIQLAHVEKVNEQLKEISIRKMEGEQVHSQQKLINTLEQQTHDKNIRLAEIDAESASDRNSVECDKDIRNHRDVEISKARWEAFNAMSDQWSQALTTTIRWGCVGGGVSFVAYCCVQVARVYFGQ